MGVVEMEGLARREAGSMSGIVDTSRQRRLSHCDLVYFFIPYDHRLQPKLATKFGDE